MEKIKMLLGKGGLLLAMLGILSSILSLFNYDLRLLAWINFWGDPMAWFIRTVLIISGGALIIFYGVNQENFE